MNGVMPKVVEMDRVETQRIQPDSANSTRPVIPASFSLVNTSHTVSSESLRDAWVYTEGAIATQDMLAKSGSFVKGGKHAENAQATSTGITRNSNTGLQV